MKRPPKDLFFVSVQLLLFVLFIFRIPAIDIAFSVWLRYLGLLLFVAGAIILIAAFMALNKNLSPFPTPKRSGELVDTGVYHYIRHPIYTGILFMAPGLAFYTECAWRFLIFVALLILFIFKATYEELLLLNKYPGYAAYKKTTGMFFPRF